MIISDSFSKASEHMHERKNGQHKTGQEHFLRSQASLAEFSKPLPAELFRKEFSRGSKYQPKWQALEILFFCSFFFPPPNVKLQVTLKISKNTFSLLCVVVFWGGVLCAPTSLRLMFFRGEVCIVKEGKVRSRREKRKQ